MTAEQQPDGSWSRTTDTSWGASAVGHDYEIAVADFGEHILWPLFVPPFCDNCHHAYGEHTGRSLGWQTGIYPRPIGGPAVGPPDRFHWGGGCSVRVDSHHTCPCSEWMIMLNGQRETQRSLEAKYGLR